MTREDALQHPNWSMGAKITVDSATLMNKGLEFIEAMRLYELPPEKISIVVHRESIVHSLVEYCDNAVLAQLGAADMCLPIQYALTWPERAPGPAEPLDLLTCPSLTFQAPDPEAFPCLALALEAARTGGTATAILNGANEAAVGLFLDRRIGFMDIARQVERAMEGVPAVQSPGLEEIFRRLGERKAVQKVVLHPLMVVAGDHAKNDLAGDEPESWKSRLLAQGYQVACELKGLGEYPQIRALFVRHALEAAEDC